MRRDAGKGARLARLSSGEISLRQDELLRRHIRYCAAHSPFYREMFDRLQVAPEELRGLSDLARLPFTEKRDLESRHADFLALGERESVDLCLTSGTTGKPVAMLQSAADLERLAYNEEISFRGAGFTRDDRVLVAAALDRCFMAGLAYFLGLTRIGATVIRGGSSGAGLLAELVKSCRPSAIVGVPSLILAVGERLQQDGIDPSGLGITRLVCIGEPVRRQDLLLSPLGERLEKIWSSPVFGTYASTEMATSFTDCGEGAGGHLHPDLIALEIVDEEGAPVHPGSFGEVVATPLGVTGMPLLRFRTGDIATLHLEPCPCGRNTPRLGPVLGRKSQMLKCRGTTVYPPAISAVLQGIPGVRGHYIEAHAEFALSDRIEVVVGSSDASLSADAVAERIAAAIRVKPEVRIVNPEEIVRMTIKDDKRKPVTFFDHREA
ncbi:MAG: CoF synthetase [Geobacteraceae bacterium GWC2_58_44]|nr:MAG: CoF synthetase [Geobacteraceae bacterium GWC2_58_44]